jgi:HEAT repeat protein
MAQLASRGGIYLVFIIGMIITWVMNKYFKHKPEPIVLPEAENKTEADFIAALSDKDWHLRLWAAEHLQGVATEAALPALVKGLQDDDPDVRDYSGQALIALGKDVSEALAPLMQSRSLETREAAVKVLVALADEKALDILAKVMLEDDSAWVRIPAIETIAKQKDKRFHAALV